MYLLHDREFLSPVCSFLVGTLDMTFSIFAYCSLSHVIHVMLTNRKHLNLGI